MDTLKDITYKNKEDEGTTFLLSEETVSKIKKVTYRFKF
jgi:hypothetical protein